MAGSPLRGTLSRSDGPEAHDFASPLRPRWRLGLCLQSTHGEHPSRLSIRLTGDAVPVATHLLAIAWFSGMDRRGAGGPGVITSAPKVAGLRLPRA